MKTSLLIFESELQWDRPNPCGDCPFLKTSPYHEGVAAHVPEYVQSIQDNNFAHTCHKSDNRPSCDGPRNHIGPPQHCVGALLMLLKTGKGMDLQLPLLRALEAKKFDIKQRMAQAKKWKNVFTVLELIAFYEREVRKRAGISLDEKEIRG